MTVMTCLGQGRLHSPSASSSCMFFPVMNMANASLGGPNLNKEKLDDWIDCVSRYRLSWNLFKVPQNYYLGFRLLVNHSGAVLNFTSYVLIPN